MYSELGLALPEHVLSVLHRPEDGVGEDAYLQSILELHREISRAGAELSARLPSPAGLGELGLLGSEELRLVKRDELAGVGEETDRLLQAGEAYVRDFRTDPARQILHESRWFFRSSLNLDLAEHLVRDVMGIYEGAHGRHIALVGAVFFGLFQRVAGGRREGGGFEAVIPFSKGPARYGEFREALTRAVRALEAEFPAASAWQRKLGLGQGKEFELRVVVPEEAEALARMLEVVRGSDAYLAEAAVRRGRLLVFKRIPTPS